MYLRRPLKGLPYSRTEYSELLKDALAGDGLLPSLGPVTASGRPVVTVGAVTRVVTPFGLASNHPGAGATTIQRATIPSSGIGTTTGGGFLVVFTSDETGNDLRIGALGSENGASGNTVFSFGTGTTTASNLKVTVGGSVSNVASDYSGTNITDGRLHAALVSVDQWSAALNSTYSVYLDGANLGSAVAGAVGASSLYSSVVAGGVRRGGGDIAGAKCRIFALIPFLAPVNSGIAIELTRRLARGDWSVLFDARSQWVPVSAGGGDVTLALPGQAVTASAGTLAPSASLALPGQAVTASAGTLVPSASIALPGQAVTASAGTITYTADGNITVALSGQAVTASAGTLAPSRTIAQTGQAVTAIAGTVAPGLSKAATGTQITTSAGTLTLGIVVPLPAQSVAANTGTIAYSADGAITIALSGSAVSAYASTIVPAQTVAATGTTVNISAGTITYNTAGNVTVALSGQVVTVFAGTLTPLGAFRAGNRRAWIVDSRQRYVHVDASPSAWRV